MLFLSTFIFGIMVLVQEVGEITIMGYYINQQGNTVYLLDTMLKKCGVFKEGVFQGFTTWVDKEWRLAVGVIGVISCGRKASLIVNNCSEIVEMPTLDCAREVRSQGGISHILILRGNVNNHKVNGYVFVYSLGEMYAEEVRKRCHF